jgi:ribonuclease J
LAPDGPKKIGETRIGKLVLDGDVILPAGGATMNERRKLAHQGIVAVSLALGKNNALVGEPVVRAVGLPVEADRDDFLRDARDSAAKAVDRGSDEERLREAVRLAVRRCATAWTGKKPIVEVLVVRA